MSAPPGPGCTVFPTVGTSRAVSSDEHLPHRLRYVSPLPQIPSQFPKPTPYAIRLDPRKALSVHPDRPAITASLPPGFGKKILTPNFVDQRVKAPVGFFLRSIM